MAPVTVREVFEECQKGTRSHAKLIRSLATTYTKTELPKFWEEFLSHLKFSMVVFKREPAVERTLEFVAKFATTLQSLQREKENKRKEKDGENERKEKDGENERKEKDGENEEAHEEEEEMHPFLFKLFIFFLQSHNAHDRAVRFRCCQMINKLLNSLGDNAQIDDDLYDRIYRCMLQRLRDVFPVVRMQAVSALVRLQDPTDAECPVIKAYLFLLGCDNNPDVRRNVLSSIAVTTNTLQAILERTRDVKDSVRKVAFEVIAEKIHIKALTIAQRVRLLQDGLNDRAGMVQEACCNRMLQAWLQTFGTNILSLLQCLDVENSLETTELAIKSLFRKTSAQELVTNLDLLNEDLLILPDELTCESVSYWRMLVEHIKSLGGAEADKYLDRVLPTGKAFCHYINGLLSKMREETSVDQQLADEFIMSQLLTLAGSLDLSDEVGRQELKKLIHDLLVSPQVSHTLVKPLLARLRHLVSENETLINQIAEIISDITEPITVVEHSLNSDELRKIEVKIAGVRVELNQTREELETAIQKQEFEKAAELKAKIDSLEQSKSTLIDETQNVHEEVRQERKDPQTLLKCLTIVCEMLQEMSLSQITPTLQTLVETLVIPGIQNEDPAVRNMAVKSLGLCCLLSRDMARSHLLLFMQVSQVDQDTVRTTALQVIFDLLHTFGLEAFQLDNESDEPSQMETSASDVTAMTSQDDPDTTQDQTTPADQSEKNKTASSLLSILIGLLDSETSEIRTVAAEGLAKLLLSGRVMSAKLMSRLLLLWYNPITEDDQHLRHCLGTFFPVFAFAGRSNQELVEEAFMPTLCTLFKAPATSPLAEVDVNNVAELLVQLTSARHLISNNNKTVDLQEAAVHDGIAIKVCNEILKEPNSFNVKVLCKILNLLELSSTTIKDLQVLAESMLEEVKEKTCVKMIEKFKKTLNESSVSVADISSKLSTLSISQAPDSESPATQNNADGEQTENAEKSEQRTDSSATCHQGEQPQDEPTAGSDTETDGFVTADESVPEKSDKTSPQTEQMAVDGDSLQKTTGESNDHVQEERLLTSSELPHSGRLGDPENDIQAAKQVKPARQTKDVKMRLIDEINAFSDNLSEPDSPVKQTSDQENDLTASPKSVRRPSRLRRANQASKETVQGKSVSDTASAPNVQSDTDSPVRQLRRGQRTRNVLRGIEN